MAGQGRAGLWGAGDRPCCGVPGAGAVGPKELTWGPGPWVGQGNLVGRAIEVWGCSPGLGHTNGMCHNIEMYTDRVSSYAHKSI